MEADSISDFKENQEDIIDQDYLERVEDIIKGQYQEFTNLGINLINEIDLKYQRIILLDFYDYVNENYTNILDHGISTEKEKFEISKKVYQLICIDFYSTILPSFLEDMKIKSVIDLDLYIMTNIKQDYEKLKGDLIKSIQKIYNNIKKLESIDKTIKRDPQFKDIINKYNFYIKLLNFGDIFNFIHNYCIPLFSKNENDIIWKMS